MINKSSCKINYNIAILEELRCNRLMHYVGTDELGELGEALHVCTNRLRNDTLKEVLIKVLENYAMGNAIMVDMKKTPTGALIESLNDITYRAEPFRNECGKIIQDILMEHIDELTDRIKEVFPTLKKTSSKSKTTKTASKKEEKSKEESKVVISDKIETISIDNDSIEIV